MECITPEINRFLDHLKFERRYSEHTVRSYHDDLFQFSGFVEEMFPGEDLMGLSSPMIRSWLAGLKEEGLSSRSIARKISSLKSFFKYCVRVGSVNKSPVTNLTVPKSPKRLPTFVEEDHMDTLLRHVEFPADWKGETAKLAIRMLYELGIRLSELVNCRESQIDHSNSHIKILGKGNKERIIPLGKELQAAIRLYIEKKRCEFESPDTTYLLVNEKGKKLYPKYIYRITTAYLPEVTTIKKKSPHVLRHSFATHLSNNGAELNAVKELLGHASLAATQVYTHNSVDKLKSVHKKAHPRG